MLTKFKIIEMYLDCVNNYSKLEDFAKNQKLTLEEASIIVVAGRELNKLKNGKKTPSNISRNRNSDC